MKWQATVIVVMTLGLVAAADTIELNDGATITGRIVRESDLVVVIEAEGGGERTILRSHIKKIVRDVSASDGSDRAATPGVFIPGRKSTFDQLDPIEQELKNARAEYALGEYQQVLARVDPLVSDSGPAEQQSAIAWLIIESTERLANFTRATELLRAMLQTGTEENKIRARAHVDILETNSKGGWDYGLRKVGDANARDFLEPDFYIEAKRPNGLAKAEVMQRALEEYCHQVLTRDSAQVSVHALKKSLDAEHTLRAVREMPRTGDPEKYLPFVKDGRIEKVKKSLDRVDAILPGYAASYKLDLVRVEAEHIYDALEQLFFEVIQRYPEDFQPAADANGNLTREGREQWRQRCEDFARDLQPLIQISRYVKMKVDAYPKELRRLVDAYRGIIDRLEGAKLDAIRKKERTHV